MRRVFVAARALHAAGRLATTPAMTDVEKAIADKLTAELSAVQVSVEDQSGMEFITLALTHAGGCGAQFAVQVVSEKFRGLSLVQQHRLVNSVLKVSAVSNHGP